MLPIQQSKIDEFHHEFHTMFPISYAFPPLALMTLALTYAKLTVYFYVEWEWILSPLIGFLLLKGVSSLISLKGLIQQHTSSY